MLIELGVNASQSTMPAFMRRIKSNFREAKMLRVPYRQFYASHSEDNANLREVITNFGSHKPEDPYLKIRADYIQELSEGVPKTLKNLRRLYETEQDFQ